MSSPVPVPGAAEGEAVGEAVGVRDVDAATEFVEVVEVVVAHRERTTLRVGDVYLKVDGDRSRADVEVAAMGLAPVPTASVLWREPPVLALAALPGRPLGRLGEPSDAPAAAWEAAGALVRGLHDAPLPPWPGRAPGEVAARLDEACTWLVERDVLPADLVARNRRIAAAALREWTPVFAHGDLQVAHVFVDGAEVTGVLDWSEAGPGDALYDLACLTFGHAERLEDVLRGYGADGGAGRGADARTGAGADGGAGRSADARTDARTDAGAHLGAGRGADARADVGAAAGAVARADVADVVRAWWSLRSLTAIPWLLEHGFDPFLRGCEVDILRAAG